MKYLTSALMRHPREAAVRCRWWWRGHTRSYTGPPPPRPLCGPLARAKKGVDFDNPVGVSRRTRGFSSVSVSDDGVYLKLDIVGEDQVDGGHPLVLHPTWLRDHCQCPLCYDKNTFNKLVDIGTVDGLINIRPKSTHYTNEQLHVTWPDEHQSVYDLQWLRKNVYSGYKEKSWPQRRMWNGGLPSMTIMNSVVDYTDYIESDTSLTVLLKSVVKNGFGIIKNVPLTEDGIVKAAERICPLRLGFFGQIRDFRWHMLHSSHDGPFKGERIVPHADQTYLTEPAGLKLVHCVQSNAKFTMNLVDGYEVAEQLRKKDEGAYVTLSSVPVASEYVDSCFHHRTHDVILKHDAFSGNLLQVRHNDYYRSPLSTVPTSQMDAFYDALYKWTHLVEKTTNQCRIQFVTGSLLVMDNWRILSAPTKSDESVKLRGCYLGWSDYMCRARRLKVTP